MGGAGGELVWAWTRVWKGGCCYVCVSCDSRLFVYIGRSGICILYYRIFFLW